ncbi:MAG TPA: ribonuclease D, partial [Anaeromyxobacteraceae bacterium]|nr:ribonuclease D [Anaeromyxobacteraceae bacterium]
MTPPVLKPVLVADPGAVAALAAALRAEPRVALDTESNSFHAYKERVCLIQVSVPGTDWIVDPIATDVAPLGEVLCDGRETVFHGADYDVRCLKRDFGWALPNLFDTMVASRRLGVVGLGLSALVEARFGIRLSKAHQRSDWGRRPLSRDQLAYAALDTHYLLRLREALVGELEARGLLEDARAEFTRIAAARPHERVFDPEGWRRLKGAKGLDDPSRRVLRALWIARERRAEALGRPPFKVLGEQAMLEIAVRRPDGAEALGRITGVTPAVLRNAGEAIL